MAATPGDAVCMAREHLSRATIKRPKSQEIVVWRALAEERLEFPNLFAQRAAARCRMRTNASFRLVVRFVRRNILFYDEGVTDLPDCLHNELSSLSAGWGGRDRTAEWRNQNLFDYSVISERVWKKG
jgi:hypothetical protein